MLEKFLAAEVLEVRVLHPAIAQSLVGKVVVEILQINPKPASMFAFSRPSCKTDARC